MGPTITLVPWLAGPTLTGLADRACADAHRDEVRRAFVNVWIGNLIDPLAFVQCRHSNADVGLCEDPGDDIRKITGLGLVNIESGDEAFRTEATDLIQHRMGAIRGWLGAQRDAFGVHRRAGHREGGGRGIRGPIQRGRVGDGLPDGGERVHPADHRTVALRVAVRADAVHVPGGGRLVGATEPRPWSYIPRTADTTAPAS